MDYNSTRPSIVENNGTKTFLEKVGNESGMSKEKNGGGDCKKHWIRGLRRKIRMTSEVY